MKQFLSFVFFLSLANGCGQIEPHPNLSADRKSGSLMQIAQESPSEPTRTKDESKIGLTAESLETTSAKTNPDAIYCPTGTWYSPADKMCVTETQAAGPFTHTMIGLCKKYGGGEETCESPRWARAFAARLRQKGECPQGAEFRSERLACVEGQNVFGPFRVRDVENCRRAGGGPACESMRWNISFLPLRIQGGSANRNLLGFYKIRVNYDEVYREVLKFYPTGRRNGCVAFMSTALRLSGTAVPINESVGGESVSLVTKPFANYLQQKLGWTKITSANNLQPGDVVLTEDDTRYPGYPAHTYMFYGWSNQRAGTGWVIDNQDFIHERNIFGYGTYNFTPFAYALRSPQ